MLEIRTCCNLTVTKRTSYSRKKLKLFRLILRVFEKNEGLSLSRYSELTDCFIFVQLSSPVDLKQWVNSQVSWRTQNATPLIKVSLFLWWAGVDKNPNPLWLVSDLPCAVFQSISHCVLLEHYYSVDFPWWFDRKKTVLPKPPIKWWWWKKTR